MVAIIIYCNFILSTCQWTPLHIAVREGQEVTVEILVDNEADLKIRDKYGVSVAIPLVMESVMLI